jgi:hypothetical protein
VDPLVSPAVILAGELPDDFRADRRAARPVRVGSLPGYEAAVPPKHGPRGDQPVRPQASEQEPDERGEDRAVGRVQAWPGIGPSQHGNLVPQRGQLDVLRRR